ncbi:MAG: hypothetical protein GAK31_02084 [Stenotrophomonas maltophilia]|uniref:DUF4381 domain-containing protein n=1 Tax=Stenotrophomonas maltophilia TaxID=40324 RepID=A0A7V8JLA8_STEMA|nr:MAG: hypothetical protein GAK31_02084 [Stenotrophomonas maltophilia]
MSAKLPLRDVQLPPSPAFWPPPLGWRLVLLAVLLVLAVLAAWQRRRRLQRQRWERAFDDEVAAAATGVPRITAIVTLLRRAQRRVEPGSEALQGTAWLARIDPAQTLSGPQRELLLEGAYRPEVSAEDVETLRQWARPRFLALLLERRR